VHLHVPIYTIEFLLKLTPACSRNTWIDEQSLSESVLDTTLLIN
jgi:hypothetical protein